MKMNNVYMLPGVTDETIAIWAAKDRSISSKPKSNNSQPSLYAA